MGVFLRLGGEVVALLGHNGAGKTTAVRCLSTLLRLDRGQARVAGFDVTTQSRRVRERIALVGQAVAVDEQLTAQQNLVLFGRLRGLTRSAAVIVLGRCLADLLSSLIALALMIVFGLAIGWRPETTAGQAALALALLILLRFALLWVGLTLGYRAVSVESVAFVQILVWPVALFSSVFVDPASMPAWLGAVAELNPVSATATTVRDLLGTVSWPGQVVPLQMSAVLAVLWPLGLTGIFLPLAARSFRASTG